MMFRSARIKLTVWYLCIIMTISLLFSFVLYRGAQAELDRISFRHHMWTERFMGDMNRIGRPLGPAVWFEPIPTEEIRHRMLLALGLINGIIFVAAGGAGYFLAGRTLKPIKDMMDEQNRFITDASHELRTPLTALRTSLEVNLRDKKLSLQNAKNVLKNNLSQVRGLSVLSDNLLDLAQMQKPNENLKFSRISLRDIIEEAVKTVQALALDKNIQLNKNIEGINVFGDKTSLEKLCIILLDNAVKYSHTNGCIEISATKADGLAKIVVRDYGIGIAKKDLPFVFDRFYRADNSRSKTGLNGFGLGLSIAKRIVENHWGSIYVRSQINEGSTFTVTLPATTKRLL